MSTADTPQADTPVDLDGPTRSGLLQGPWTSAFWVSVPIEIRSKSNHRHGGRGRDSWSSHSGFENDLGTLVHPHIPADWALAEDQASIDRRPTVVAFMFARTMLDAFNLEKSIGDALQHLVYANDASVQHVTKLVQRTKKADGALLAFAQLPPGASLHDKAAAGAALQEQCLRLLDLTRTA